MLIVAIAGVATSALFGEHGIAHLLHLRAERRAFGDAVFGLMQRNTRLRANIARLRSDDQYLEALARQQLGLVRPDETVYHFRRPPGGGS